MNINEFSQEFDGLKRQRQVSGLKKIFDFIVNDVDENRGLIEDIFDILTDYEQEDYFGTEGFDV